MSEGYSHRFQYSVELAAVLEHLVRLAEVLVRQSGYTEQPHLGAPAGDVLDDVVLLFRR